MGAVDLVVQIEAPPSIASASSAWDARGTPWVAPRPGYHPEASCRSLGVRGGQRQMRAGEVEETYYPRSPLDVLAQQIVPSSPWRSIAAETLFALVRRAAPYAELPVRVRWVLDMLWAAFPPTRLPVCARASPGTARAASCPHERARTRWPSPRRNHPDRGLYGVFLSDGRRVGELDEEMVFELRLGEIFSSAPVVAVEEITMEKWWSPCRGEPGKMPFSGAAIARAIAGLRKRHRRTDRMLAKLPPDAAVDAWSKSTGSMFLPPKRASNTCAINSSSQARCRAINRWSSRAHRRGGRFSHLILSPFGARGTRPGPPASWLGWRAEHGGEADVMYNDDGIVLRVTGADEPPKTELFLPPSESVEDLVTGALGQSALFAARFRENAARALLLPRRQVGKRTPLWAQRRRRRICLSVAARFPSFPILPETYRECLRDVFDLPGPGRSPPAHRVAKDARLHHRDTARPPLRGVAPVHVRRQLHVRKRRAVGERRAQALTIDHAQLRELLETAELSQTARARAGGRARALLQRLAFPRATSTPCTIFCSPWAI